MSVVAPNRLWVYGSQEGLGWNWVSLMVWEAVQLRALGFWLLSGKWRLHVRDRLPHVLRTLRSNVQGANGYDVSNVLLPDLLVHWALEATGHGGSRINALLINQVRILLGVFAGLKNRSLQHAVSCQRVKTLPVICCLEMLKRQSISRITGWDGEHTLLSSSQCLQKPRAPVISKTSSLYWLSIRCKMKNGRINTWV